MKHFFIVVSPFVKEWEMFAFLYSLIDFKCQFKIGIVYIQERNDTFLLRSV